MISSAPVKKRRKKSPSPKVKLKRASTATSIEFSGENVDIQLTPPVPKKAAAIGDNTSHGVICKKKKKLVRSNSDLSVVKRVIKKAALRTPKSIVDHTRSVRGIAPAPPTQPSNRVNKDSEVVSTHNGNIEVTPKIRVKTAPIQHQSGSSDSTTSTESNELTNRRVPPTKSRPPTPQTKKKKNLRPKPIKPSRTSQRPTPLRKEESNVLPVHTHIDEVLSEKEKKISSPDDESASKLDEVARLPQNARRFVKKRVEAEKVPTTSERENVEQQNDFDFGNLPSFSELVQGTEIEPSIPKPPTKTKAKTKSRSRPAPPPPQTTSMESGSAHVSRKAPPPPEDSSPYQSKDRPVRTKKKVKSKHVASGQPTVKVMVKVKAKVKNQQIQPPIPRNKERNVTVVADSEDSALDIIASTTSETPTTTARSKRKAPSPRKTVKKKLVKGPPVPGRVTRAKSSETVHQQSSKRNDVMDGSVDHGFTRNLEDIITSEKLYIQLLREFVSQIDKHRDGKESVEKVCNLYSRYNELISLHQIFLDKLGSIHSFLVFLEILDEFLEEQENNGIYDHITRKFIENLNSLVSVVVQSDVHSFIIKMRLVLDISGQNLQANIHETDLFFFMLLPIVRYEFLILSVEKLARRRYLGSEEKDAGTRSLDRLKELTREHAPTISVVDVVVKSLKMCNEIDGLAVSSIQTWLTPMRSMLKNGKLKEIMKNKKNERYVFLFNDYVITTKSKSKPQPVQARMTCFGDFSLSFFIPKRYIYTDTTRILDCTLHDIVESHTESDELLNMFQLIPEKGTKVLVFSANSKREKKAWMDTIMFIPEIAQRSMQEKEEREKSDTITAQDPYKLDLSSENIPYSKELKPKIRGSVIKELIDTERVYVADLEIVVDEYMGPLGKLLAPGDMAVIFSNIEILVNLNTIIMKELETLVEELKSLSNDAGADDPVAYNGLNVGTVFLRNADYFKMYTQYCSNHNTSTDRVEKLRHSMPMFDKTLDDIMLRTNNLGLLDFLIKPLQRIMKYPLLLLELLKNTMKDENDYDDIVQAYLKVKEVALSINENKRSTENSMKIIEITKYIDSIDDGLMLVKPGRYLIREADINKSSKGKLQERHFWLFNDVLLYAKRKGKVRYVYKGHIGLAGATLRNLPQEAGKNRVARYPFMIIPSSSNKKYILHMDDEESKSVWFNDISAHINRIEKRYKN